jgi:phosphopantetheine adenylyltransferase
MGAIKDISDTFLSWYREIKSGSLNDARRKRLREMLEDKRFKWRKLQTLADAIGATPKETRELLVQLKCRPQEDNPDYWGLIARNPTPPHS